MIVALCNLGNAHDGRQATDRALAAYTESAALARSAGLLELELLALNNAELVFARHAPHAEQRAATLQRRTQVQRALRSQGELVVDGSESSGSDTEADGEEIVRSSARRRRRGDDGGAARSAAPRAGAHEPLAAAAGGGVAEVGAAAPRPRRLLLESDEEEEQERQDDEEKGQRNASAVGGVPAGASQPPPGAAADAGDAAEVGASPSGRRRKRPRASHLRFDAESTDSEDEQARARPPEGERAMAVEGQEEDEARPRDVSPPPPPAGSESQEADGLPDGVDEAAEAAALGAHLEAERALLELDDEDEDEDQAEGGRGGGGAALPQSLLDLEQEALALQELPGKTPRDWRRLSRCCRRIARLHLEDGEIRVSLSLSL